MRKRIITMKILQTLTETKLIDLLKGANVKVETNKKTDIKLEDHKVKKKRLEKVSKKTNQTQKTTIEKNQTLLRRESHRT